MNAENYNDYCLEKTLGYWNSSTTQIKSSRFKKCEDDNYLVQKIAEEVLSKESLKMRKRVPALGPFWAKL